MPEFRTVQLKVEIPGIPEGMADDEVREWARDSLSHPYDAYYEAFVNVSIAHKPVMSFGAVIHPDLRRKQED
jgi:hypothetical protein